MPTGLFDLTPLLWKRKNTPLFWPKKGNYLPIFWPFLTMFWFMVLWIINVIINSYVLVLKHTFKVKRIFFIFSYFLVWREPSAVLPQNPTWSGKEGIFNIFWSCLRVLLIKLKSKDYDLFYPKIPVVAEPKTTVLLQKLAILLGGDLPPLLKKNIIALLQN